MFNIADIIVIALILIATFLGYKRGFIKTGFGMLSFLLAIVLTFIFYKPVMNLISEKTGFETWLSNYLYNVNIGDTKDTSQNLIDDEHDASYLEKLPQNIVNALEIEEIKANAKNIIVEKIVKFVLKLLAIVLVYIIARLILGICIAVLDSIAKLPVLKQCNEILGLGLGMILGLIQVYCICAIITLIGSLPAMSGILSVINNSLFAHSFYDNNLLFELLF